METFSPLLALCVRNSPHKGQWRGVLMFSLICAWTNGWVNNRNAGDLRRHRAHYDVIVMCTTWPPRRPNRYRRPRHVIDMEPGGVDYNGSTFNGDDCATMSRREHLCIIKYMIWDGVERTRKQIQRAVLIQWCQVTRALYPYWEFL